VSGNDRDEAELGSIAVRRLPVDEERSEATFWSCEPSSHGSTTWISWVITRDQDIRLTCGKAL
jgi:hypothetical protein